MGGAENMCENLVLELRNSGCEVIVVSLFSMKTAITDRLENQGIKIVYLGKKFGADFSQIFKLYKLFRKEKPDVVHMHLKCTAFCMPAAVLAGVKKRVYTIHHPAEKDGGKLNIILNTIFIHYCHMIPVALTEENKISIERVYHPSKNQIIPVIKNGINLHRCIEKKNYEIKDGAKIIHIGRFEEPKNHLLIVNAFSKLIQDNQFRNIKLLLIGTGSLLNEIKSKITELELMDNIKIIEGKSSCFLDLHNADIFILPSKWEGMPMTLIEAMGTGLPCIASNVGGIPDMVSHSFDGLLIEPNEECLIDAIKKLVNDTELRIKLGENAKNHAKRFSSEIMAKEYIGIYGDQTNRFGE